MDSDLLKTFLEVSKTKHFGKAAEALYLTQSTVSFRIRQLETQIGSELFTRHRNNIRLTKAGESLIPYAEKLMDTWLMAKKAVLNSQQHKEFSIAAPALLWEFSLAPWLAGLYQHQPDVLLEARIGQRHTHVRHLHERTLDLLIATESPKMDEFSAEQVGEFSLQLMRTQTQEGIVPELPFISLDWGADFKHFEYQIAKIETTPILKTSSLFLASTIMSQCGGRAFFPSHWPSPFVSETERGILIRPIYAIWLQNNKRQEEIKQILDTLKKFYFESK